MEQHALQNVNNCLNINIYSYLETFGANVLFYIQMLFIFSTPVFIRQLWQLKTVDLFKSLLLVPLTIILLFSRLCKHH
jgi:hypothetical protein